MAVSPLGLVASGAATDTDTLVLPILSSIPRSDPAGGGTIILIWQMFAPGDTPGTRTVTDDAPTDSFYDTHLYTDGMNPYDTSQGITISQGLVLNPLDIGNNITLVCANVCEVIEAIAVAYSGAQVDNQTIPSYQGVDNPASVWFEGGIPFPPYGIYANSPGGGTQSRHLQWTWVPAPPGEWPKPYKPLIMSPFPVVYDAWEILTGEVETLSVVNNNTTDPGAFTPNDGTWAVMDAHDQVDGSGNFVTLEVFEKTVGALPEVNGDLDGVFASPNIEYLGDGYGRTILSGLGPVWAEIPPPFGGPMFHHVHRAGD